MNQNQAYVNFGSQNSYNQSHNYHMMTQKQLFKQEQLQDQALIQYYIFEDYQNLINLIYSYITVEKYFEQDPQNQMVVQCRNKIIAQLNLSNTIHCDLQQKYKGKQHQKFIIQERQKVLALVSHLPQNIQESKFLQYYKTNSLSENVTSSYKQLEPINVTTNFNQNVVAQVMQSMQLMDQRVNQIASHNHYNVPTSSDVQYKANQYQNYTQMKLEASYPKYNLQSNHYSRQQQQNQSQQYVGRSQSCEKFPQQQQNGVYQNSSIILQSKNRHQINYVQGFSHVAQFKNLGNY